MTEAATQTRYRIEGMDCAACAAKIDTAVRRVEGVADVSVSVTSGTMTVHHSGDSDLEALAGRVRSLGYGIAPLAAGEADRGRTGPRPGRESREHDHAEDEACGSGDTHRHDHDGHDHSRHDHSRHGLSGHDHRSDGETAVAGLHGHDHRVEAGPWWRTGKGRLTIAAGLALVVAYAIGLAVPAAAEVLFIVAMLVGLVPIARRAVMAALNGTPFSIEMLMTIAAIGAVFIGAGEEGAMVVFLFLIGEMLEGVAASRARASIQSLAGLVPQTALLVEGGATREIAAAALSVGATVLVRPGDRLPADGVIVSGESAVDEAPVTGESTPVSKGAGAAVFAGTINGEGALHVRVTAAAADNTIARVIRLVEEAQESKAPTERFIDRFSRIYTPGVVVVAALVAVLPPLLTGAAWAEWIYKGLAILLIGCPCALVISTPAAIAAALSAGARRGLLLKGGAVLETLGKVDAVAFDKTGTLTEGRPVVTDVVAMTGVEQAEVVRLAAALETGSSHPLAHAILARAEQDGIAVPAAMDGRSVGGKGIAATVEGRSLFLGSAQAASERAPLPSGLAATVERLNGDGKTVSILLAGEDVLGALAMRDEPRPDARAGLAALAQAGARLVMLTGDNPRTAAAIGRDLGIEVRAGLLPQDKQRIVGELRREGRIVAKVGDGINDAPALAAADVGIAMGGGTDVALETADAAVLHGRVMDIAAMIDLSRRTLANIHANIAIALGLKGLFLVTTLVGITGLWPAILADTGATVLVTMNALRLLQPPRR